jgi:methylphosphotriester-DNA--protein-cysteine methyltransferase
VVSAALHDQREAVPEHTVRDHFRHATGLTHKFIQQMQRVKLAQVLLRQGTSVLDTLYEAGYFDQAHLMRSLQHFLGYTPAQIARLSKA